MKQQMPPVAQFNLQDAGQSNQTSQQNVPQTQTSQKMPPVAQFNLSGASNSQQSQPESFSGDLASGNYGGAAVQGVKNVGNFLFPYIGDVGADIQGKSDKTALQQAGDAALSVLPLIPGLGEVGEAVKGGEAAVEGAKALEGGADIAKSTGLMGKTLDFIKGSPFAKGALTGYGAGVASNLSQGQGVGQALRLNPTNIISAMTGGAMAGMGKLLGIAGDKISFGVIKPSAKDIADGFDINTVKNNNLGGTLNQTLKKTQALMAGLTAQLKEKLQGSTSGIDLASIFDDTKNDLTSKQGLLSGFGQNSGIGRSLQKLQDEVLTANPTGKLSIPEAQIIKQATGGMGAWQFGSADPDATSMETVYNTFYNKLKTAIEDNSPAGVKDINQKLSDLIPVQNAVIRRIPIAERNAAISLPDMIGLVGSVMNPLAAIPTVAEMASKSGVAGSILSKVAPAIQKWGPATAGVAGARLTSGLLGNNK